MSQRIAPIPCRTAIFVLINHFWVCAAVVSWCQPVSKWLWSRYSIFNLVFWGITFDSEKWYKAFLLQNYPWQLSVLFVIQIIIFLNEKYMFYDKLTCFFKIHFICMKTDSDGSHLGYLWQWQLPCGLFKKKIFYHFSLLKVIPQKTKFNIEYLGPNSVKR